MSSSMMAGIGGAGTAAAPFTGGASLLLPLLASFAPAMFSKLFGGQSAQQKLQKQIMGLLAPQNMSRLTNQFYQQNLGSPGYSQAQSQIAAGGNLAQNNLMANLGARGIGTSGGAAVMSSLIPGMLGQQQAGLRTSAYDQAANQAQQNIKAQIDALTGTSGPSQNMQLFGAGLSSFMPFLQKFMGAKYPSIFGAQ
jgi:hypothetical protein